jgi:hypothetical protein
MRFLSLRISWSVLANPATNYWNTIKISGGSPQYFNSHFMLLMLVLDIVCYLFQSDVYENRRQLATAFLYYSALLLLLLLLILVMQVWRVYILWGQRKMIIFPLVSYLMNIRCRYQPTSVGRNTTS